MAATSFPSLFNRAVATTHASDKIGGHVSLMKMDIQGHEVAALTAAAETLESGQIEWIILGTHSESIHAECLNILGQNYEIVHDDQSPPEQPDGLIVARFKGSPK